MCKCRFGKCEQITHDSGFYTLKLVLFEQFLLSNLLYYHFSNYLLGIFLNESPKLQSCGSSPRIPFAVTSSQSFFKNHSEVGSTVLYKCQEGYRKTSGDQILVCSSNGIWSGERLRCSDGAAGLFCRFLSNLILK